MFRLVILIVTFCCSVLAGDFSFITVGPYGGDVRSLAVDPMDPDRYYLGTNDGQIYLSTDGAVSWQRLRSFSRPGYSVDKIVIDATDPNTIYVPLWYIADDHQGTMYKSTDRGITWRELTGISGHSLRSVAIAPSDSRILVAVAIDGAYQSDDAGETWRRITPEGHPDLVRLHSVAIDPVDPKVIYIGTEHLPWKTTDGGNSWFLVKGHPSDKRLQLIDDSDIFSIVIDSEDRNSLLLSACSGIYRSTDGASTWTKFQGIPFTSRRTHVIYPDPVKKEVIYSGTTEGLWKSTNRGSTWRLVTSLRTVVNAIAIHSKMPTRIVIGTKYGGVMLSTDEGNTFKPSNSGFVNRYVSVVMEDKLHPDRIYAATLFNGFDSGLYCSDDGGHTWQRIGRGLEAQDIYSLIQSPDGKVIYAGTNTGLFRSTDAGHSWSKLGANLVPKLTAKKVALKTSVPPTSGHISDRVTGLSYYRESAETKMPALLIASWSGLFKLSQSSSSGKPVRMKIANYDGKVLSVASGRPMQIYAGTAEGLYRTDDDGKSWQRLDGIEEGLPVVQLVAVSPHDPQLVIVGTQKGCYLSRDGGQSWQRRGKGIPYGEPIAVYFDSDPAKIAVGDFRSGGVYVSDNKGESFSRIDKDLPSDRITTILSKNGRLILGSFSGGIYLQSPRPRLVGSTENQQLPQLSKD
ncbi:MAG: hypothetical protein RMM17_06830 [Acidobacteriota bacterium]|nr:hypothetical protein [Blastocatellia bacterium]MDW8412378.1 hypothetical protein [Acidobacteriota bacterium]